MNRCRELVNLLKSMDDEQLEEMFYDLDDINLLEHIGHFALECAEMFRKEKNSQPQGKSDYELYREQDDARRAREGI